MSVKTEAYVAIEEALADKLRAAWQHVVATVRPQLEAAARSEDWERARTIARSLDLDDVLDSAEGALRLNAYAALMFGASRLTDDVKATWVGRGGADVVVNRSIAAAKQAIAENVREQIEIALLAEIDRLAELGVQKADADRTLYARRDLLNHKEFSAWAKAQGFETTMAAEAHVTLAYSKKPVNWGRLTPETDTIRVRGGRREVHPLGDGGAIVLRFDSPDLSARWQQLCDAGCSWDYDGFTAHVTITWDKPADLDLKTVEPYDGELVFGPEVFEELDDDWEKTLVEKANPYHDELGRFTSAQYAVHVSTGAAFKHMHNNAAYVYARAVQIANASLKQRDVFSVFNNYVASIQRNPNYTREEVESIRTAPMDNLDVWKSYAEAQLGVKLDVRRSSKDNPPFGRAEFFVDQLKWGNPQEQGMFMLSAARAMGIDQSEVSLVLKATDDKFVLNGEQKDYGGYYRRATKGGGKAEIALYSKLRNEKAALSVLLHEHGHHKFAKTEFAVMGRIDAENREAQNRGAKHDYVYSNRLRESGKAVSSYARDWWQAYEKESTGAMFRSAVNETLAEINAMTPQRRAKVSKEWLELYGIVQTGYQESVDAGKPT